MLNLPKVLSTEDCQDMRGGWMFEPDVAVSAAMDLAKDPVM